MSWSWGSRKWTSLTIQQRVFGDLFCGFCACLWMIYWASCKQLQFQNNLLYLCVWIRLWFTESDERNLKKLFLKRSTSLCAIYVIKELVHALAVHLSSYGCTWEVGRALEKLEWHEACSCDTAEIRFLLCGHLDFASAVTPQYDEFKSSFDSSSSCLLNVKT